MIIISENVYQVSVIERNENLELAKSQNMHYSKRCGVSYTQVRTRHELFPCHGFQAFFVIGRKPDACMMHLDACRQQLIGIYTYQVYNFL